MLFLRPLITSKDLSVIVFWDFHFLVWNPPLNSLLAFPASCCPQGPASEALWSFTHLVLCVGAPAPQAPPLPLSVLMSGAQPWLIIRIKGLESPWKRSKPRSQPRPTASVKLDRYISSVCSCTLASEAQFLHLHNYAMLKSTASHRRVRSCSPSSQQTSSPFSLFKACMSLKAQLKSFPSHRLHHHNLFWIAYKAH